MKRLNRKGFTLVELLAVIVILAIIVGIVFPQVMTAMDNSRVSSIHSSAKGVVNWWDNAKVADSLVTDNASKQIPSDMLPKVTTKWTCIDKVTSTYTTKNLFELAGLSSSDLVTSATGSIVENFVVYTTGTDGKITYNVSDSTCSAIRLNATGGLEVLLVAKNGGRYYVSGKTTFGYSVLDSGVSK